MIDANYLAPDGDHRRDIDVLKLDHNTNSFEDQWTKYFPLAKEKLKIKF